MKTIYTTITILLMVLINNLQAQNYNTVKNSNRAIYSCSGNLYDHGGPNTDYSNNSSDTFSIYPDQPGKIVQLKLNSFSMSAEPGNQDGIIYLGGLDEIDINGVIQNSYILGHSGENDDYEYTMRSRNPEGTVNIIAYSTPTLTSTGFDYSISCIDGQTQTPKKAFIPKSGNKEFTTCSMSISDNGFNSNYSSNTNGSLTIHPASSGKKVKLTFSSLDLGSGDTLYIYDGIDQSILIEKYYLGSIPNDIYASYGNITGSLTIRLFTDATENSGGFNAQVSCSNGAPPQGEVVLPFSGHDTVSFCGGYIYDSGGSTDDFTKESLQTTNAYLTVLPTDIDKKIKIVIEHIEYEDFNNTLRIYDGFNASANFIGSTFGSSFEPGVSASYASALNKEGALTIRHNAGQGLTKQNFRIRVECVEREQVIPGDSAISIKTCSSTFYDMAGSRTKYIGNQDGAVTFLPEKEEEIIKIDIQNLNITNGDFLYVYNGKDTNSELISRLGYWSNSSKFIADNDNGALTVRFKTNDIHYDDGFKIISSCIIDDTTEIRLPKSGHDSLITCSGTAYDHRGSQIQYENNIDGSLTLTPSIADKLIEVNFKSISLEENFDFIYVYDGNSTNAPLIGEFSKSDFWTSSVYKATNPKGELTIRQTSNASKTNEGVRFDIECIDPLVNIPANGTKTITSCNTLVSDYYSNTGYWANWSGGLTILPTNDTSRVKLDIQSFNTEVGDELIIYDGKNESAKEIFRYSGNDPEITQIISSHPSGALFAYFRSNGQDQGDGFMMKSSCLTFENDSSISMSTNTHVDTTTCNVSLSDDGGFSGNYSNNSNGVLTIFPDSSGLFVGADLQYLETQKDLDILKVYNGIDTTSPLLASWSGNQIPSESILRSTNNNGALTFHFTSNSLDNFTGFGLKSFCYEPGVTLLTNSTLTIATCDTLIYDDGGKNNNYAFSSTSQVIIYPSEVGQSVQIDLDFFETELDYDNLKIYDGSSTNAKLLNDLSGSYTDSNLSVFAKNPLGAITLEFYSDNTISDEGFTIKSSCYQFIPEVGLNLSESNERINTCDTLIRDNGGYLGNYSNNSNDILTVYPNENNKFISVDFTSFSTSPEDILYIYNGTDTNSSLILEISGDSKPDAIYSNNTDGALTFQFKSDNSFSAHGFELVTSCFESGVLFPINDSIIITSCDTIIYDNGGLNNYSSNVNSKIQIIPNENKKAIKLTIIDFDTENGYDFLSIYNGTSNSDLLVQDASGKNWNDSIFIAENTEGILTIEFKSDDNITRSGFILKASCEQNTILNEFNIVENDNIIYPNPNPGNTLYLQGIKNIISIQAISNDGKIFDLVYDKNKVDVNSLKAGIYTLNINTESGIRNEQLIIH